MNNQLLDKDVQVYIRSHTDADVHKIAMAKSPFPGVTGRELSAQISARKKCIRKLPLWFHTENIYYPSLLSVEQCSSAVTADYKAKLAKGDSLIDITGGYGVDSYFFAKTNTSVIHCEINKELSDIAAYNAKLLGVSNMRFVSGDGMEWLKDSALQYTSIYIDPARRSDVGKVFMLKDCTPNVVAHLDLLLSKATRVLIKTAPLLDISAGLKELKCVEEVHIVSVRNECKELIWVLKEGYEGELKIISSTLNDGLKQFSYTKGQEVVIDTQFSASDRTIVHSSGQYLYEPDVALLKSGAFNLIAERYCLQKLDHQTHLYVSSQVHSDFPGRIFQIEEVHTPAEIRKHKNLVGNVIVRNYPAEAAVLTKKYKIKAHNTHFLIFTQSHTQGKIIIRGTILQHY